MSTLISSTKVRESGLVLSGGLALLSLFVAVAVTAWFVTGGSRPVDQALFRWFQDRRSPERDAIMEHLSALGSPTLLVLLMVGAAGLLGCLRKYLAMVLLPAYIVAARLMNVAGQLWIERPRPNPLPDALLVPSASFPSGHAMMSVVIYGMFALLLLPAVPTQAARIYVSTTAVVLIVLVGVSRLYLGVHYITDVVAGWAFGTFWLTASWGAVTVWKRSTSTR